MAKYGNEIILFEWTRPNTPEQPRTFTDAEIAAWYAVAARINADSTGCGLWCDDPAMIGVHDESS